MKRKLLFVFNPHAGKGLIKNHLLDIVDIFAKAEYEITIYPTQCSGDATRIVESEAVGYDRVICSGGDGTLNEVVSGMVAAGLNKPIGYIPAGSTNDFANSLELPKDMRKAAQIAVEGMPFPCDVGMFNGNSFIYVAAFGLFSAVAYQTPQEQKNVLGHLAYIIEGAKQLLDIPSVHLQVEYEGNIVQDAFIYGMITNSVSVGGFKGMTGNDVKLDDGVFEVTLIKMPKNAKELNEILASLTNLIDATDLIYSFKTDELKIVSKDPVAWTLDGEFGGDHTEVSIYNLNKQVTMLVEKSQEIKANE